MVGKHYLNADVWKSAADSSGEISVKIPVINSKGREIILLRLQFKKRPTGVALIDEVADFELSPSMIICKIIVGLSNIYWWRIQSIVRIIVFYLSQNRQIGQFSVSIGDEGLNKRLISFSSNVPDYLVPDPCFVHSKGYAPQRSEYLKAIPWRDRQDILYWRGTDTGIWRYRELERAPRIRVCLLAKQNPSLISAFITGLEDKENETLRRYYNQRGIFAPRDDQDDILNYRFQLDVDGNTSAWSSFFLKLLSGSPVLKVASEWGWRQWYYSDLVPEEHYVSVKSDMSDLVEKVTLLRDNPARAAAIGQAGRRFALSRVFETEITKAAECIERLINFNIVSLPQ